MKAGQPMCIISIAATAALSRLRFVTFTGAQAGAGVRALGVADADGDLGEMTPVTTSGIALVEAGAAIAPGALITTDASGRAVTNGAATFANHNGYALDAATGAGEIIRVMLP